MPAAKAPESVSSVGHRRGSQVPQSRRAQLRGCPCPMPARRRSLPAARSCRPTSQAPGGGASAHSRGRLARSRTRWSATGRTSSAAPPLRLITSAAPLHPPGRAPPPSGPGPGRPEPTASPAGAAQSCCWQRGLLAAEGPLLRAAAGSSAPRRLRLLPPQATPMPLLRALLPRSAPPRSRGSSYGGLAAPRRRRMLPPKATPLPLLLALLFRLAPSRSRGSSYGGLPAMPPWPHAAPTAQAMSWAQAKLAPPGFLGGSGLVLPPEA